MQAYHLYPCTSTEQLFHSVLRSRNADFGGDSFGRQSCDNSSDGAVCDIFTRPLQLDFAKSRFSAAPRLLFQNNALGEWFKVRLARHQGISIGLTVGHSKEVLEHYLRYFFPELQADADKDGNTAENWIHSDIVSLLLFRLLQHADSGRNPSPYLPKALSGTLQLLEKQGSREAQTRHLWAFTQNMARLFLNYDNYREELKDALEAESGTEDPGTENSETENAKAKDGKLPVEAWQQNLWRSLRSWTEPGFHWHGELIEQVLSGKLSPRDASGSPLQPEPLYIIGSGFLSARQLSFYCYLSQFTTVHHFWLTPARFPPDLCQEANQVLRGQKRAPKQSPETAGETGSGPTFYSRRDYEAESWQLGERLGGLPQFLWLENSLHSAALLSREQAVQWHEYGRPPTPAAGASAPHLLELVQQHLCDSAKYAADGGAPAGCPQSESEAEEQSPGLLGDGSIRYFACSDRHREVEVLKDQILAALDAHPDWQLNDIAVLAPDINQYRTLIQAIFQKSGPDYGLDCNFIDLKRGAGPGTSPAGSSEYFSAFAMLLSFAAGAQARFRLDECLRFMENPCTRAAKLLEAKPGSFWSKVFEHWKLSWGIHGQQRGQTAVADSTSGPTAESGTWHSALELFVRDYLTDYQGYGSHHHDHPQASGDIQEAQAGQGTDENAEPSHLGFSNLCRQMSLDETEARLLAEVLQTVLRLHERLSLLADRRWTISEWVTQLESLQEEFLLCRSEDHYSDRNDRSTVNNILRNFLAVEESLSRGLAGFAVGHQSRSEAHAQARNGGARTDPAQADTAGAGEIRANADLPSPLFRLPFVVIRDLLQQKLEQNSGFKGRYLTQGITCASLQPYRSVPFRMICVLGLNEEDFPRRSTPLRFDLCAELPRHLSGPALEQHIFAELLISAGERLFLFYRNRDISKGAEKNPSASLYDLAYFVAKMLRRNEEEVWQRLTQVHPLFSFDGSYFGGNSEGQTETPDSFFSYSRSSYEQHLASENPDRSAQPRAVPVIDPLSMLTEPASEKEERLFRCHFRDLLAAISNAPAYFWQHYSGLNPNSSPDSRQGRSELPLPEQFAQGDELLMQGLAPLKQSQWQRKLWREMELLLPLLGLSAAELREFLQTEGLLGSGLFRNAQWQSLCRGLEAIKADVEQNLIKEGLWPGWQAFRCKRQYSLLLQGGDIARATQATQAARLLFAEPPGEYPGQDTISGQGRQKEQGGQAAFLLPALRLGLDTPEVSPAEATALFEGDLERLWFDGERVLCWNNSPFLFPVELYNLLQSKLFQAIRQSHPDRFGPLRELLQVEWTYDKGLQIGQSSLSHIFPSGASPSDASPSDASPSDAEAEKPNTDNQLTLEDYLWLLWRARCEPLPLSLSFLSVLKDKSAEPLRTLLAEFCETGEQSANGQSADKHLADGQPTNEKTVAELQNLLREQWQVYLQQLQETETTRKKAVDFKPEEREALQHLSISFVCQTLQNPRFWLLLHELLEQLTGKVRQKRKGKKTETD
ncbi:exodeoxyribonuclease V subunit gamma [Candidatus Haliotispira prima]|uniref:Exodeoxyribonuclease V subunit gamma n=1 Tax=Candidatus Haliotispira prima TaxID=3034016 RepID=A0ABY8MK20_9SPIO|nr:exodeoxyribonuclease V subunit gamma [Candidatus Haliotispira prima]